MFTLFERGDFKEVHGEKGVQASVKESVKKELKSLRDTHKRAPGDSTL